MYHAKTDEDIKNHITSSFNCLSGSVRFSVATVAFGMGIDCKGLLNDYFQQSGRAGRDGIFSTADLLLYLKSLNSQNVSEK